jgi:2-polyprenyl-6-methoxyphenol hydroxylase-like FAD-dependent oxidoreductase
MSSLSLDCLEEWTQTALLSVESSRLGRWYRPGLLLIGDAAHVMSPASALGITMAIADAVAAASVLGPRLQHSAVRTRDLASGQRRREWHRRLVQWFQATLKEQNWPAGRSSQMSYAARLVAATPALVQSAEPRICVRRPVARTGGQFQRAHKATAAAAFRRKSEPSLM